MAFVAFDFDETLCVGGYLNQKVAAMLPAFRKSGFSIAIVTSRNSDHESEEWVMANEPDRIIVQRFVNCHSLDVDLIVYCCHRPKGPICKGLGVSVLFDNDSMEVKSCLECGVNAVLVTSST